MKKRIRIVLSGIGNRALPKNPDNSNWLGWVEQIIRSECFQLVAAHDISEVSLKRIIDGGYLKNSQTYKDLDLMLSEVSCDAILISNPAEYHGITMRKALDHDLDVLVEKPFVTDLAEGKELVELIEKKGKVAAVVQNWRSKGVGRLLRETIQGGMLGEVGHIFFRYIRDRENPNYPPYIFEEKYPLLYAMGIHHLDLFRYILKEEYSSVSGHSFKPPWSLYKSDTGLILFLKTKSGISIMYSGTISSRNKGIPQESLVIEGEKGTLVNESQWLEPPLWFYPRGRKEGINLTKEINEISIAEQYNISDSSILKNFYQAIMHHEEPICTAKDGLQSVAVLEASRLACETGKNIYRDQ
jgi:predicted dehydrogenase